MAIEDGRRGNDAKRHTALQLLTTHANWDYGGTQKSAAHSINDKNPRFHKVIPETAYIMTEDSHLPSYAVSWLENPVGPPGPSCPKCGSKRTVGMALSTRAGSKGDVQFCYCKDCGFSWSER
ncbi:MAG: hypothetical protein CMA89_05275 [Euryarchaeota archaeon]|nr:hypothetical protein [Euryarchaeota archaeon]